MFWFIAFGTRKINKKRIKSKFLSANYQRRWQLFMIAGTEVK
jgi:hypothetical protein